MKQKIKSRFNAASSSYESVSSVQKECAQILAAKTLEFARGFVPNSVLDLGAGTGYATEAMLKYYPDASYTLNDIAPSMLEMAQTKFPKFGFCLGDMEEIDFGMHDLIIANLSLQWLSDLEAFLLKLNKSAKVVVCSCLLKGTFAEWEELFCYYSTPSPLKDYPTEKEISELLTAIDGYIEVKDFSVAFENAKSFMKYLSNLGASASHIEMPFAKIKEIVTSNNGPFVVTYKVGFVVFKGDLNN
ncbi:MAG: bioC [Candidatus Midichloriaceae bacterium]|jgi:malonyl-CoA O-methyltransferase|nr:bioC [Candidatus Midichloriaceae bacterium]